MKKYMNVLVLLAIIGAVILSGCATQSGEGAQNDKEEPKQTATVVKENTNTEQVETSAENTLLGDLIGTGVTGYRDVYYPVGQIPDRLELKTNNEGYDDVPILILEDFEVEGLLIKFTLVNPTEFGRYLSKVSLKINLNNKDTQVPFVINSPIPIERMLPNERRAMTMGGWTDKEGNKYIEGITLESDIR